MDNSKDTCLVGMNSTKVTCSVCMDSSKSEMKAILLHQGPGTKVENN